MADTPLNDSAETVKRPSPPRIDVPQRVGRYQLIRQIGRGGMGEVWHALDVELDRPVALKFLIGHDAEDLERFAREAKLAGRLSHPSIAAIYEFGETESHAFLAMQFIDGVPLSQADLTVRKKVEAVRDAARAVAAAHGLGVIHRDLKPNNLMLDREGRLYVLDFGLARDAAKSGESISHSGMMIGTPAFMAPEQARGKVHVDERSDVWALGATLYALLAGESPFAGATVADVLANVLYKEPISLRRRNDNVDRDLETIVSKCLEKEIPRRYRTASDVAEDLDRWLRGEPIAARPAGFVYRVWKRARRSPVVTAALVLAVAGIAAGAAVGVHQFLKKRESERLHTRRLEDLAGIDAVRVRIEDARLMMYRDVEDLTPMFDLIQGALGALDALPDLPESRFVRGWALELRGRPFDARREYERAVDGGHGLARIYLARIYALLALPNWTEPLERSSEDAALMLANARRLLSDAAKGDLLPFESGLLEILTPFAANDWAKMVDAADRALARYPHEEFHMLKALALKSLARFQEALDAYDAAIEMRRGHFEAYFWRAEILRDYVKRPGDAMTDYNVAIRIHKQWPFAWARRCLAHINMRNFPEAIADGTEAVRLDPTFSAAYGYRGWAKFHSKDFEGALADFLEARRYPPDRPGVHRSLCSAYAALGRYEEAAAAATFGLKHWDDAQILMTRAEAYRRWGRRVEAAADYEALIRTHPKTHEFIIARANFRAELEDFVGACDDLRRALALPDIDADLRAEWQSALREWEPKAPRTDF